MAIWMVRAGKHGEHEQKFLDESRLYLTWNGLDTDLSKLDSQQDLRSVLEDLYPNATESRISNFSGQIWSFGRRIQKGDWCITPSKFKRAIHICKVDGDYHFEQNAEDPYYHFYPVKWLEVDIPRSNFDADILLSLGAAMSICQIKRNDAENRIKAMQANAWKSVGIKKHIVTKPDTDGDESVDVEAGVDLELAARDQIAQLIISQFKGHALASLIDSILRAQGYTTYVSPPGPDKGIDILAATGPLGFGQPRICVQVKSSQTPLDRPTLDQLIGTMQNVGAEQGLLVSWGGFKRSIDKETASQFFRVRLWDQDDIINQLLTHYDEISEELRAELPLKRIWIVADVDD